MTRSSITSVGSAVERVVVGVDENGLGPQLGPLLVTAAIARVGDGQRAVSGSADGRVRGAGDRAEPVTSALSEEDEARIAEAFAPIAARAGDSKALVDFHESALGEAWARAVLAAQGTPVTTPDELFDALLVEPRSVREGRCPSRAARDRCFGDALPFSAPDSAVDRAREDLEHLARHGITILGFAAESLCVRVLNDGNAAGRSRFTEDLRAMERLLLRAPTPLFAVCGKVGGYTRYAPHLHHLAGRPVTTHHERRDESRYTIGAAAPGGAPLGTIAFRRDADGTAPLVGLASLVGKYLRDRAMRTIGAYHLEAARAVDPTATPPSGYYDPVTARFVAMTAAARAAAGLPEGCFLRDRASDAPPPRSLPLFGGDGTATSPRRRGPRAS